MTGRAVLAVVNGLALAVPPVIGFCQIGDGLAAYLAGHEAAAFFVGLLAGLCLTLLFLAWSSASPKSSGEDR